jgi:hypothetical protein
MNIEMVHVKSNLSACRIALANFNGHINEICYACEKSSFTDLPGVIGKRLFRTGSFPLATALHTDLVKAPRHSYIINHINERQPGHYDSPTRSSIPWVNYMQPHVFRRGRVQAEFYSTYHTIGPITLPLSEPDSCDLRFLVVLDDWSDIAVSGFAADVSARCFSVPTLVFAL